jgi:hypothetical protein
VKLTLDDIADLRAYEREREAFRERIIALKRVRRVQVGPVVTLVFENRDTVRFQVQEMARAEKLLSDEQIRLELDVYNPLIPEAGQLSATLFVELTSEEQMREWLPKLVGIERAVELRMGDRSVRCMPEEQHARQLTREEVTASVHYVRFELTPEEVVAFEAEPVVLAVDHPAYHEATPLSDETKASLRHDLLGLHG